MSHQSAIWPAWKKIDYRREQFLKVFFAGYMTQPIYEEGIFSANLKENHDEQRRICEKVHLEISLIEFSDKNRVQKRNILICYLFSISPKMPHEYLISCVDNLKVQTLKYWFIFCFIVLTGNTFALLTKLTHQRSDNPVVGHPGVVSNWVDHPPGHPDGTNHCRDDRVEEAG